MPINIVYSTSELYSECTGISIFSLLKNNNEIDEMDIYILETKLSFNSKSKILQIGNLFSRRIIFVDAQDEFNQYTTKLKFKYLRGSYNTYARVMLNAWFSHLDKVLLIDSDTLVIGSIKELWDTNIEKHLIGAVPEIAVYSQFSTNESSDIVSSSSPYFNMGIVLINLKLWRDRNIDKYIEDMVSKYNKDFLIADQSILNYTINQDIYRLHLKYNYYSSVHAVNYSTIRKNFCKKEIFSLHEFEDARKNPIILHFIGHPFERPWYRGNASYYNNIYQKYRLETPWANDKLRKIPRAKNILFALYDKTTYILLKLHMYKTAHWYRYIIAQKWKNKLKTHR
ncbi:MAG: glycosyltransferase family 8 protein [Firmicutes bacterium]|nr:glycosyltransferase family 8 protein [Bacillota bacterium]